MEGPLTADMPERVDFFFENAGFCVPPGRMACAVSTAEAEHRLARDGGVAFSWEPESEPWDGEPELWEEGDTLWLCRMVRVCESCGQEAETLQSLGMIHFRAPDPYGQPYARVIEAELYEEETR